jgi:hypothetical protein
MLTLYHVATGVKLGEFLDYSDPLELSKDQARLSFWIPSGRATKQNCGRYSEWLSMGLGALVEARVYVDLPQGKLHQTGQYRCSSRQAPIR